jgi:DNA-directed RNA polymerase specialized sigma24 family protein
VIDLDDQLAAIAAGDPDAFGRWVAGAEHELRASLASFAATVDSEVIVQETLLRMWQVAPRVERDGRPNSLLRLALRSARNLAIDHTRRLCRELPLEDGDYDAESALMWTDAPDPLLRELIAECHAMLPPQPSAALRVRIGEGGANHDRDLAARVGMTLNTFLKNIGRARALLAECLGRRGVDLGEYLGRAPR